MYSKVHDVNKNNTRTFSYVCHKKISGSINCCNSINLPGKKTDAKVIDYIMRYDENELKKCINIGTFTRKVNKFDDKLDEISFEIKKLEKNKQIYINHLMKLSPSSPLIKDVEDKVKNLNEEIQKLIEQKRNSESQFELATAEKSNVEQIFKNLRNFKKNFRNLDFDNKKSLLRLVIDKLTWNGVELKIFLNGEQN